jgi:hypothetical protein
VALLDLEHEAALFRRQQQQVPEDDKRYRVRK